MKNKIILASSISLFAIANAFDYTNRLPTPKRKSTPNMGKVAQTRVHKDKTILNAQEILIKRMTNHENHQWMKARAKNRNIAPDQFVKV